MNTLTKSLLALSLLTGTAAVSLPARSAPAVLSLSAPAQDALQTLLDRPDSPMPSGTRLQSVKIADGLATVSFSHELRDNFTGGDSREAATVNSVLKTLGQFPTVSRVQILVEGQPIDSLGGLLELSQSLPVIRPADAASAPHKRYLHRRPRPAVAKSPAVVKPPAPAR